MTPALRVAIGATALSGVAGDSGIGRYARGLLGALSTRPDITVRAIVTQGAVVPDPIEPVRVGRLSSRVMPARARARVVEEAVRVPIESRVALRHSEVWHNTDFHAPLAPGRPWVQTLFDVIPLVFEAPDLAALRARWGRFGPRYRSADSVVAISAHAASEGRRLLGIDPDRIHVAHLGVDGSFGPTGDAGAPCMTDRRPYLLVVGEHSRRKGNAEAFAVLDELVDRGYPHRLVHAGRVHPWAAADLARLRSEARHPERIDILGFVDDLPSLYRGADCYVMASRYEGFGLPAIEAMACGTPVVAFSNSAVTEVVDGGGVLVADGDVEEMVAAVRRVLDEPAWASELAERGRMHAAMFTWDRCAAVHVEAYRDAVARS